MEYIKRNYIEWALLILSFILPFFNMGSVYFENILAIIAFIFSEQIAEYIKNMKVRN